MPFPTEQTETIDGQPVFWRSAPSTGPVPLYLHGVPSNSDDWIPFLELTGGFAPDLPGFGRSSKRGGRDYTVEGYDHFIEWFCEHHGLDKVQLLVHDWGAVGLSWAQRFPAKVERLVIINAVPFLPGYRWHRLARAWRMWGIGELVMGSTNRITSKQLSREANATPGPLPDEFLDSVNEHFDLGTQRAILELYRTSPERKLEQLGANLGAIECPALIIWGDTDPYIPARFADDYAAALGGPSEVLHLPDAGHWPWFDRPDVITRVADFFNEPG
ncbi:MAG: alpha/beta fold hydrolase [Actinobacteria bacterium]|uniref:Unannotated protein n=1 Tax=freshwater metagenome TaxID=449393 RepID=A0A6J5ZV24_9ZZZZ|nr:alpha/beta fold hydrolase [Actinomycetota bacterium]